MSIKTTFRVKDYVIYKKRIGKGAFSTIYRGYNRITKQQVAIKEITLDIENQNFEIIGCSLVRYVKQLRYVFHQ